MQVSTKLLDDLKSQNRYLVRKIERLEQDHQKIAVYQDGRIRKLEEDLEVLKQSPAPSQDHEAIPMLLIKDVLEEFKDKINYNQVMWCHVDQKLKTDLIKAVKLTLTSCKINVPQDKVIINRLKKLHSSRRNTSLTNLDTEKKKKRKLALKASRKTFVARQEAVTKAVREGRLEPTNKEGISSLRKSIPQVPPELVSPPDTSSDEEAQVVRKLKILERAREAKNDKRRKLQDLSAVGTCHQSGNEWNGEWGSPQWPSASMDMDEDSPQPRRQQHQSGKGKGKARQNQWDGVLQKALEVSTPTPHIFESYPEGASYYAKQTEEFSDSDATCLQE